MGQAGFLFPQRQGKLWEDLSFAQKKKPMLAHRPEPACAVEIV